MDKLSVFIRSLLTPSVLLPPAFSLMASSTTTRSISKIARSHDVTEYIPLHRAILRGDWEKAQEFFGKNRDAFTAVVTSGGDRAIHIAVGTQDNLQFIENLLNEISPDLLLTMLSGTKQTPLHRAAVVGNIKAAELLVKKNPQLLFKVDGQEYLPIHRAVFNTHKTTFLYLLDACKQYIHLAQQDSNPFEGTMGAVLLSNVISSGFLDVAYELVKDYPHLARITNKEIRLPLMSIAENLDAYLSGTGYNYYESFIYSHVPTSNYDLGDRHKIPDIENHDQTYNSKSVTKYKRSGFYSVIQRIHFGFWKAVSVHDVLNIKKLQKDKVKHHTAVMLLKSICEEVGKLSNEDDIFEHYGNAYVEAVRNDTVEPIREIINSFPHAIWTRTSDDYTLPQIAIINRCENVYNFFIYEMTHEAHLIKTLTDDDSNNLLHLAAKLAPIHKLNVVSGAALQMQRELQWFKAVENFIRPKDKKAKNKKEETPFMMFRSEHAKLRKEGEEWMKKTADSYTITAALIITIVFAAAITVPGGTNGDTGKAIYLSKGSFFVFAISDAISLFTSTTSLLLFLSILTARYAEEDFLYKLPKRLILGLAMLFLSVTSMMIAFSATLYLMFGHGKAWIVFPIATLACLPIASFVTLQLPLLFELISSTYGHGIFGK